MIQLVRVYVDCTKLHEIIISEHMIEYYKILGLVIYLLNNRLLTYDC